MPIEPISGDMIARPLTSHSTAPSQHASAPSGQSASADNARHVRDGQSAVPGSDQRYPTARLLNARGMRLHKTPPGNEHNGHNEMVIYPQDQNQAWAKMQTVQTLSNIGSQDAQGWEQFANSLVNAEQALLSSTSTPR
jgi:hypothetical protein